MDEQQLPPVNSASLDSESTGALDATSMDNVPVSSLASPSTPYPIESIEVREQGSSKIFPQRQSSYSPVSFSKRKAIVISACITLIVTLLTGVSMLVLTRNSPNLKKAEEPVKSQDLALKDATNAKLPNELQGNADSLLINGDVITRGNLQFSNGTFVTVFRTDGQKSNQNFILPNGSGTLCLDSNNCGYASVAQLQGIQGQLGPSVTSLNGRSGTVNILGGSGIVLNGLTISNAGVLSLGGQTGAVSLVAGNGISVSGTTIANTGVVSITSSNSSISVGNSGNGVYDLKVGPTSGGVALGPVVAQEDPSNNSSIHINKTGTGNLIQFAVDGTDKFILGPNGIVGPAYGGTGVDGSTVQDGQLLIGDAAGNGFTLANITEASGSIIKIKNTAGGIEIGNDPIDCNTCANNQLSNLAETSLGSGISNVSINRDLLTASNSIDLGSDSKPFGELYLAGSQGTRANNFKITGTPNAAYTLNLDNVSGNLAVVQSSTTLTQGGNILINGIFSSDTVNALTSVTSPIINTAVTAGSSANLSIRSGLATTGSSGNISIDVGGGTTRGTLTLGTVSASGITIGRSGLAVSLPGGLTTSNGAINAGAGAITSGLINSQTISATSNFTGTVTIQGANALTLGSTTNVGAIKFNTDGTNFITLQSPTTGNFALTLPDALPAGPGTTECLNVSDTGIIDTQVCSGGGLGGSGTPGTLAMFSNGGASVADSLLMQSSNTISLLGATNNANLAVGTNVTIGVNGAVDAVRGQLVLNDGSLTGRTVAVEAQQAGSSYTLQLPASGDDSGTCLILATVSPGVKRITASTCDTGGPGGNVNVTGSPSGYLLRGTANGPNYTAGASLIQDDGSGIGIGTAPQASTLLTVGSSNAFKVTDAGAISASASIASAGLIQSTASGQALTLSGAPVNTATQSLLRLGGAIVGGNSATDGGTYLGLNAPGTGLGSAADFLNFQRAGTSEFLISNSGDVTGGTYNGLALQSNAIGFQMTGGTAPRTLTVTASATIDQDLSTTSDVDFKSLTLADALGIGEGGTGIDDAPVNNTILLGTTGGVYEQRTLTDSATVTLDKTIAGVLKFNSVGGGSCPSCALTTLGNIGSSGSVAIPNGADLQPANAGQVNLGSNGLPFGNLYLSGTNTDPANNRYLITGRGNITGLKTLTLPNFTGTFAVLQDTGSAAQGLVTEELNIAGLLLAGKLRSPELKTVDNPAGSQALLLATGASGNGGALSGNITLQSGDANMTSGTSGNIILDVGTANTTGNILITPSTRARVGIGISDPNTALDIVGGLTVRSSSAPALAPTDQGRFFYDATTDTVRLSLNGGAFSNLCTVASCTGNGSGATLQVAYTTSTGSTTPEILLDATRNAVDIQDANTSLGATTNLFAVRGSASTTTLGELLFGVQGSGNVAIGVSTPTAALHVGGSQPVLQTTGNGAAAKNILQVTGIQGGDTSDPGLTGGAGSVVAVMSGGGGNSTGSIGTGGASGSVTIATGNGGNATGNGATGTGGAAGSVNLSAGNGGNATASTAGIGGAAGNVNLTAGNGGGSVGIAGVTGGSVTISGGVGGDTSGAFANANGGNISLQGGAAGTGGSQAAGYIGNILLAGSGGNVGVGTTTPTSQLQVAGGTIGSGGTITMTATNGGTTLTLLNGRMTLNTGDYVVPATTTSQARAITIGGTNATTFTVSPAFSANINSPGESFTVHKSIFNFTNTTGTSSLFGQGSTGNVGIGTTAPTSKFQMVGSSSLAADGNSLVRIQSANNRDFLTLDTTSVNNLIANPSIESPVQNPSARPYGWVERDIAAPAAPTVEAIASTLGTVSITNGSNTVTGSGTDFSKFAIGEKITISNQNTKTISSISPGPSQVLTVDSAYNSTAANQAYTVTGATSWGYKIVSTIGGVDSQASTQTLISNGVGTLTATNFNRISWPAGACTSGCKVYRTAFGTSPSNNGLISTLPANSTFLNDTNLSGSGTVPVNNTVRKDASTAKAGSSSMVVTTSLITGSGVKSINNLSLTNLQTYTISFYAQRPAGSFPITPGYYNGTTENDCAPVTVPTSWGASALTCTFTANATTPTGYIYFKQADGISRSFNIDSVQLETGATATTYNEASLKVYSADGATTLLTVNNSTNQVIIGTATNGVTFGSGSFEPVLTGNARHTKTINLTAEYAGAVLDAGDSNANIGTLTAGFDSSTFTNYYQWSTSQTSAQTYDLVLRVPIPSDWSSWVAGGMAVKYNVDSTSNASVSMQVYGSDNTSDIGMTVISSSTGWQTSTPFTLADAKYSADGTMTIRLRLNSKTASGVNFNAKVANITLQYNSKY